MSTTITISTVWRRLLAIHEKVERNEKQHWTQIVQILEDTSEKLPRSWEIQKRTRSSPKGRDQNRTNCSKLKHNSDRFCKNEDRALFQNGRRYVETNRIQLNYGHQVCCIVSKAEFYLWKTRTSNILNYINWIVIMAMVWRLTVVSCLQPSRTALADLAVSGRCLPYQRRLQASLTSACCKHFNPATGLCAVTNYREKNKIISVYEYITEIKRQNQYSDIRIFVWHLSHFMWGTACLQVEDV